NHVLHFRIFDGLSKMVVDTDEQRLTGHEQQILSFRFFLTAGIGSGALWSPHVLSSHEKQKVIDEVAPIVSYTPLVETSRDFNRDGILDTVSLSSEGLVTVKLKRRPYTVTVLENQVTEVQGDFGVLALDDDTDGVDNAVENGAPNSGDGNFDFRPDSGQA